MCCFERIDNCGFAVTFTVLNGRDIECGGTRIVSFHERNVDRGNFPDTVRRSRQCLGEFLAAALGDIGFQFWRLFDRVHRTEQLQERRIGAQNPAVVVERGNRYRRVVEEARKADFRCPQGLGSLLPARPVQHQPPAVAGLSVFAEWNTVQKAHWKSASVAGDEVEIEGLAFDFSRLPLDGADQFGAVTAYDL